jgi:GAF domain-containing protein
LVDGSALSSVLSGFASTLAEGLRTTSVLDELTRRLAAILPLTSVGVSLLGASGQPEHTAASDEVALGLQNLRLEDGPCLLAMETREPVTVPDLATEERFPDFTQAARAAGVAAVHAFPLQHAGRQLGALALYRSEPGALPAQEVEVALTLAGVATAYVITARDHEEAVLGSEHMRHLASHDALTGLPNRRLLLERLEHAGQRARRTHAAAGVLFVDLDRFKLVNDTYGTRSGTAC